ncbi:MAG: hypothetical protein IPI81_16990 [Flavobacteriales bacterium]|nr:hypothetical protein [Flavobacteriales bacterium]MCC6938749.1 hypothetical protein [Flavobacteriales bacterium]
MIGSSGIGRGILFAGCMVCLALTGAAQNTGKLRIFCEPAGSCSYIVDGKHRLTDREITLMEGPHTFVFWAPERRMHDTTLVVVAGTTTEARVQLRYSEEYITYRHRADRFTRNERWIQYGPPLVTLGAGAWSAMSITRALKARKDLDALADEYNTSTYPAGITALKNERIPDANIELRQARIAAFVSSGVFVATGAASYLIRRHRRTRIAPAFEDKEKVRFDGLVWVPGTHSAGTWAMGFTIPIR